MSDNQDDRKIIRASPTKGLFITMLVRDLTLRDAIGDLVDNSVDGAKSLRPDGNYNGLEIKILANNEKFSIYDNCGGIESEIARNYAFRFGRPKDKPVSPGSVGQFGIGMKRSLFKLGNHFVVSTIAQTSRFDMEVDVNKWQANEEDWDFAFKDLSENEVNNVQETFTEITVSELNEDVVDNFVDPIFINKLVKEIELEHLYNIASGLKISINGVILKARKLELVESNDFKTAFYEETFHDGMTIKLYAGIGENKLQDGGWYVFCNDRLVVGPEQSSLTGWTGTKGDGGPIYHGQFQRFRGYAFLNADDSSILPWNTTKNGMDRDSPRYKYIRQRMIELMKPVISFLNQMKKEREGKSTQDERQLEKIVEAAAITPISEYKPNNLQKKFVAPPPTIIPKKKANEGKITYLMPLTKINEIKKRTGATNNREVGELTFNYYYEMEIED